MGLQDRCEHEPITSAHIDDFREAAPVEAGCDLRRLHLEPPVHLGVERAPQLRVGVEVGPELAAVALRVGGSAGGDGPEQVDEGEVGPSARAVDVEQDLGPVLGQLEAEAGGAEPVRRRVEVEDADCDQVIKQAS